MVIKMLIALFLFWQVSAQRQQIFINYGVDSEGVQLFKFFHNVTDGYYVDIGAYDSIFASNTLNLEVMGWKGINIDASPKRLPRFFYSRPWEPSLNYAIGDQDKYVTFYQLAEDSSSTLSPQIAQLVKSYKPVVGEQKVPSLSMKQICERFFQTRPLFLNLDIEGYGSKALMGNDWKNQKCRPDIIFSEIIQQATVTGLPLAQSILTKYGYKKWGQNVGLNEIYIHESVYDHYSERYIEGTRLIQKKRIDGIQSVGANLGARLGMPTTLVIHHEPLTDNIFYHFTKRNQVIDLHSINKYSNLISQKPNRPICIVNFDPHSNTILLRNQNYSTSTLQQSKIFKYDVISVYKNDGSNYSAYIFDHFVQPEIRPKIIVDSVPPKQKASDSTMLQQAKQNANSLMINQKILIRVQQQLQKLNQKVGKVSQEMSMANKELTLTLMSNHNFNKLQFENLLATYMNSSQTTLFSDSNANLQQAKQKVQSILKNETLSLFCVFFSFLTINALLCILHENRKVQVKSQSKNPQFAIQSSTGQIQKKSMGENMTENQKSVKNQPGQDQG